MADAALTAPQTAGRPAPLGSSVRAIRRLALYLGVTLALIPVQVVAVALESRLAERLPVFYHRLCWRILGLQVECRGVPSTHRPTLFVSNHSSYADIAILGGLIPGCFVAKAEVASWPLFGLLAKLQRTVFVDRQRRTTRHQRDDMARRLAAGQNLMLFPEGTSDDGNRLLPFRSALFSVAERRLAGRGTTLETASEAGRALPVQPVSIVYARLNDIPIGRGLRPFFAWYGDMELAGHFWRLAGLGKVTVVVEFHPTVDMGGFGSRKALSEHCHRAVADGMARAITGRRPDEPGAPPKGNPSKGTPPNLDSPAAG